MAPSDLLLEVSIGVGLEVLDTRHGVYRLLRSTDTNLMTSESVHTQ